MPAGPAGVFRGRRRGKDQPEYELLDTGVFDEDRYFDVFVEYAKGRPEDLLIRITAINRGPESARRAVGTFPRGRQDHLHQFGA